MPNEVRDARGSPSFTPGSSRSQATLDLVRQVIAQLFDIAGAHEEDQVIGVSGGEATAAAIPGARLLRIPTGTVKTRLMRARAQLREQLA